MGNSLVSVIYVSQVEREEKEEGNEKLQIANEEVVVVVKLTGRVL